MADESEKVNPSEEQVPEPAVMASGTAASPVLQVFESSLFANGIRDEKTTFTFVKKIGDWTQGVFGDQWVKEKKGDELSNIMTVKGEVFLRGSHHFLDLDGSELLRTRKQTWTFNPKEHYVHLTGENDPLFVIHKDRKLGDMKMTATVKDKAHDDAEVTLFLHGNLNTSEATISLGEGGDVLAKLHRPYAEGSKTVPGFEFDVQPGVDCLAIIVFGFLFTQQGLTG